MTFVKVFPWSRVMLMPPSSVTDPVVGVRRVDPDVVAVAAPAAPGGNVWPPSVDRWKLLLAIEHLVRVRRVDVEADVVAGAADEPALPAHRPSSSRRHRPSARASPGSAVWMSA